MLSSNADPKSMFVCLVLVPIYNSLLNSSDIQSYPRTLFTVREFAVRAAACCDLLAVVIIIHITSVTYCQFRKSGEIHGYF